MQKASINGRLPAVDVERIISNTAFSMEAEGFDIPPEQKEDWRKVLMGEMDVQVLMKGYLEKARRYGAGSYDGQ